MYLYFSYPIGGYVKFCCRTMYSKKQRLKLAKTERCLKRDGPLERVAYFEFAMVRVGARDASNPRVHGGQMREVYA